MTREQQFILRFVAPTAVSTGIAVVVMGIGGGDLLYSTAAYLISQIGLFLVMAINLVTVIWAHQIRVACRTVLRAIHEVTAEELLAVAAVMLIVMGLFMISSLTSHYCIWG